MKAITQQILFLTSYPPRECGIATYSYDLAKAIKEKFGNSFQPVICALDNGKDEKKYPAEVKYALPTQEGSEKYIYMAGAVNEDDEIGCVFVQHEFGLYGGEMGSDILYFLANLEKPVITTFHTVLPNPDETRKIQVQNITSLSQTIIVMTKSAAKVLIEDYGVEIEKITIIPHGTHLLPWKDKKRAKKQSGLEEKLILSVFGLLSRNKSIETTLDALPEIKKHFPEVLFLIMGRTHPGVLEQEGEVYREFLENKVKDYTCRKMYCLLTNIYH